MKNKTNRWVVRLESWNGRTIKTIVMREEHGDDPVYDTSSALYKAFARYASKYQGVKKASIMIPSRAVHYNDMGQEIHPLILN